mmetsp:Transcript_25127/g.45469  ORF Transcript_25127/g.45469 Transcript_25127/m.45469 type:complete len:154 (+) Transcript_25127:307-768(+)
MTFPVWTDQTLQYLRERKIKSEEKALEALDRIKDTNIQLSQTTNPIHKAMHFRNVMKAHEDLEYSGYNTYNKMSLEQRDMIHLSGGLHLCSSGSSAWTKKDNGWFGGNNHVSLGSASVSQGEREEQEKKILTERELESVAFDGLRRRSRRENE